MRYEPIVAPTIKELFVQRIEDMILSGELKPDFVIPFQVERKSVVEALDGSGKVLGASAAIPVRV